MERIYCHIVPPVWTVRHPDMASGWLTRFVREHGYEVQMVDLNAELYRAESRPAVKDCWDHQFVAMDPFHFCEAVLQLHGDRVRRRIAGVVERGCRVFGMMLTDGNARFAARLSLMIKELAPDAHVVAGGAGATSLHRLRRRYGDSPPLRHPVERELEQGHAIDSWALGEGEVTLLELLQRLEAGQDLAGLPGLVLTRDGPLARLRERPLLKQLDRLPLVDFAGFDLGLYTYRALPFQLSRGCAFARCSHCGLKGYSRGFRVRGPEHAVAELEQNIARYGVREFHFTDMGVNGDLERLEGFCDEVIRRRLEIQWQSFVQIRADMTPVQLRKIVASGCTSLNYGFESGSDVVLRAMRKPYTAADAAKVLRMTREAGGEAIINLMCGHPGETEEEFERTLQFLTQNAESIGMVASVAVTGVHVHSPLLDERERFGLELVGGEGGWRSTDGRLDWRVRNERAHRLTEHLRVLGIPCFEAFWETAPEAEQNVGPAEVEGAPAAITGVVVTAPDAEGAGPFRTDRPLMIHVGYRAGRLRRAVFDLELQDPSGEVLFATPPTSASLRTVELHEEGWVRMAMGPYDLPPGPVQVAAMLRSAGGAEEVHVRYLHPVPLLLLGPARARVPVMTPYTWTHHPGRLAAKSASGAEVLPPDRRGPARLTLRPEWTALEQAAPPSLELLDNGPPLVPGAPVRFRAVFNGLPADGARVWVEDARGRTVAADEARADVAAPSGAAALEAELELSLLDGAYCLCCALLDDRGAAQEPVSRHPLQVESPDRTFGGGLVHAPHRLFVER